MHSRELVEVAALAATHGPALIEGPGRISSSALHQYWAASKCRLDRWLRALKSFAAASNDAAKSASCNRHEVRAVLEEILIAEVAVRVWTGVLSAYDSQRKTDEAEPIARSILLGHRDVRERALALLIHSPHVAPEDAVLLNRLRRRAERWCDLLLGYLCQHYDVSHLAFEPERCREFSADLRHEHRQTASQQAWRLVLASLRVAFRTGVSDRAANPDANLEIAGSILACFPAELFNATGELQSLWLVRLANSVNDAQGMVDELLKVDREEEASAETSSGDPSQAHSSAASLRIARLLRDNRRPQS